MANRSDLTPADLDMVEEIILAAPKTPSELAIAVCDRMGITDQVQRASMGDFVIAAARWLISQKRIKQWIRKGLSPIYLAPSQAERAAAAIRLANKPKRNAARAEARAEKADKQTRRRRTRRERANAALAVEVTRSTIRR